MTVGYFENTALDYIEFIKYGSKDPIVKIIGYYFDSLGYKVNHDTIVFDKMMLYIVQDFQRHCSLKADGIIGPKTKSFMVKYDGGDSYFCPEVYEMILGNPEPNIDAYILEKFLLDPVLPRGKVSMLKGLSWAFLDAANKNNINVLHIIAHAILESDWGNSFIARLKNNLFGWRAYDSSPVASAKTSTKYAANIQEWADWWVRKYLLESGPYFDGNNENGVNVKYATSPIAGINKAFIVQKLRMQKENAIG